LINRLAEGITSIPGIEILDFFETIYVVMN